MISEYAYWIIRQRLEEKIQEISRNPNDHNFDTILDQEPFQNFVYKELGVVGGAYVMADQSRNELFYLQNKDLQRKLLQINADLPFIGIPYKYPSQENNVPTSSQPPFASNEQYSVLIDALLIGTQDRQIIHSDVDYSPDFYKYLPHLLEEQQFKKLLPFEQKLTKKGLKVIYCTAGEILFYLYIWRLLFRLVQKEGLDNGVINKQHYDQKFQMNYKFWDRPITDKGTPETDWLNALAHRYAKNTEIQTKWERLTKEVDAEKLINDPNYSFYEEYQLLGLVDHQNTALRPILDLIRYAIHIAQIHLNWNVYDDNHETITYTSLPVDDYAKLTPQTILTSLYVLERRLNRYFHSDPEDKEQNKIDLNQLKDKYQLDMCFRKIAVEFLFHNILKTDAPTQALEKALEQLHKESRFPILPYFYELTSGKTHRPKEHLVMSIWSSTENGVILNLPNKKNVAESSVAFLVTTIRPIWDLEDDVYFTKNNQSIHWSTKLSEAAYMRLFRIYSFFSALSRPLIDRVFYGEMIKQEIERNSTSTDINALSHEMSKVVDNIFELSNMSIQQIFGEDSEKVDTVCNFLSNMSRQEDTTISGHTTPFHFPKDNIKEWRIIPDFNRFTIWNKYLNMWVGRRGKFILDVEENSPLKDILKESHLLAARMYVGATMQNIGKSLNYKMVRHYQLNFDLELTKITEKKYNIDYEENWIPTFLLQSASQDIDGKHGIRQNAFLRILIASITNIFEHSLDSYYLNIRIKKDPIGQEGLRFCFVNPCAKKTEKDKESQGTRPVINSCLLLVKGGMEHFGRPRNEAHRQFWAKKAGINLEQSDIWLTKFIIPMEKVFLYR